MRWLLYWFGNLILSSEKHHALGPSVCVVFLVKAGATNWTLWCYQTEARACVFVRCVTWLQGLCTAYMILLQRLTRAVSQFWGMRLFVLRQHQVMCLLVHRYDEVYECDSKDKLPFLPRLSEHDFLSCMRGNAGLCSYRWDMRQANMWSVDGNQKLIYFVKRYAVCVWTAKQVSGRRWGVPQAISALFLWCLTRLKPRTSCCFCQHWVSIISLLEWRGMQAFFSFRRDMRQANVWSVDYGL